MVEEDWTKEESEEVERAKSILQDNNLIIPLWMRDGELLRLIRPLIEPIKTDSFLRKIGERFIPTGEKVNFELEELHKEI